MVSSTRLLPMFLLLDHFPSFSCLGAGWCPWLYAQAVVSVDDGVLQTAWCRAGSSFTLEFLGMGLVCSSAPQQLPPSYFGSLLALSEQMLKIFLLKIFLLKVCHRVLLCSGNR